MASTDTADLVAATPAEAARPAGPVEAVDPITGPDAGDLPGWTRVEASVRVAAYPERLTFIGALDARLSHWWARNWFASCALLLMMASEYKWRVRSAQSSLNGDPDLSSLLEIAAYLLVGLIVILRLRPPRLGRVPAPMAYALAYVSYLTVSVAWTPFRSVAEVRAAETIVMLALAWAAYQDGGGRALLHRAAHGFTVLVALSVLSGLVYRLPRLPMQASRFTWLEVHPTVAAVFLGIAMVLGLAYLFTDQATAVASGQGIRWSKSVHGLLLAINTAALFASQTRGAIFGLLAALLVLVLQLRPLRRRMTALVVMVWVVGTGVYAALPQILLYLSRGEPASQLETLNARTDLWSVAEKAVAQQPVYGYGLNASRGIFLDSTGLGGGHNALVNVAVDLGALGTFLLLAMLVTTTVGIYRVGKADTENLFATDRMICAGLLTFFIVDGVSIAGLGAVANSAWDWTLLVVVWVVLLQRRLSIGRVTARVTGPVTVRVTDRSSGG